MNAPTGPDHRPDRQNGLVAASYSLLRNVDLRECEILLEAMEKSQIACYTTIPVANAERTRDVFVDDTRTDDAAAVADAAHHAYANRRIALDAQEIDERFAELIGSFNGPSQVPDTPTTFEPVADPPATLGPLVGEKTEGWRRADGDWLAETEEDSDDEGYEPPPPDPLPRPTSRVVGGILLLIAGCISLFSPAVLPIPATMALVLGVALIGGGVGYLLMQLRDRPENPFDDGARV